MQIIVKLVYVCVHTLEHTLCIAAKIKCTAIISAAQLSPSSEAESFMTHSPLPYLVPQKYLNTETYTEGEYSTPYIEQVSHQYKKFKDRNVSHPLPRDPQKLLGVKAAVCLCDETHSGQGNQSVRSPDTSKSDSDPVYESITLKHTDLSPVTHASRGLQRASVSMQINSSYEAISHS